MADLPKNAAEFQAALNAASEAGARAAVEAFKSMPQSAPQVAHLADLLPKQQSEEEAFAAARRRPVDERIPNKYDRVSCLTARGATFDAIVDYPVEKDDEGKPTGKRDPRFPSGRVLRLESYRTPEFVTEGPKHDALNADGTYCVPKSMPITNTGSGKGAGQETVQFKNWKWHTFFQADLARYVGNDPRELPRAPQSHDRAAE